MRVHIEHDAFAFLDDYTWHVVAYPADGSMELDLMLRPDTNLDGIVTAWDVEGQEWVALNGWLWTFEDVEA